MLKIFWTITSLITLVYFSPASAGEHHRGSAEMNRGSGSGHHSPYAGQEKREIKSLSPDDIKQIKKGQGWGLAKAAELNGVPGPKHLLELKTEISLTPEQIKKIESSFLRMQKAAIKAGTAFINAEKTLEKAFKSKSVTENTLKGYLSDIATARQQLRFTHLAAHLEMLPLLSDQQLKLYNKLRGYDRDDPCSHVPHGHNPEMWRRHNGCK